MKIQISQPSVSNSAIKEVVKVLKSGFIVQGSKTKELEKMVADYVGVKYAVAFNSGTAAIHAALYGAEIGPGDEVITTPFTFVATANPILMVGAKPVFCDIRESDFNLDPEKLEKRITKKTKAIIAVDLYGQLADYKKISQIAKKHNLLVIEDACQSIGAMHGKKMAGSFGQSSTFSFYATKNVMCGEGGMLTTNDKGVFERAKLLRHHGQSETERYKYLDVGYNYRTTDMNAVMVIDQMKKIEKFTKSRIANAQELIKGLSGVAGLILPTVNENNRHVFHQFTIRITKDFVSSRDDFMKYLEKHGIGSGIYYPKPLHLHPHLAKFGARLGDFPVAENLATEVVSLPVHHNLKKADLKFIISTIKKYAQA